MADKAKINEIVEKVFSLSAPKIDVTRKQQVSDFLDTTINGDEIRDYLTINVTFGKDRAGAAIYVLTNHRIIRINVEPTELKSSDFFLSKTNIEWKVGDDKRTEIKISSGATFFNLVYSEQSITDFFKKVDQARVNG